MIVPMKKVHLLFSSTSLNEDVEKLQNLGVVDVTVGGVDADSDLAQSLNNISDAISVLDDRSQRDGLAHTVEHHAEKNIDDSINEINAIRLHINEAKKELAELQVLENYAQRFGEVSEYSVKEFQDAGLSLCVYKAHPNENYKKIKSQLSKNDDVLCSFSCFYRNNKESFWSVMSFMHDDIVVPSGWTEMAFPRMCSSQIIEQQKKKSDEIELCEKKLEAFLHYRHTLLIQQVKIANEIEKHSAICNSKNKDGVFVLEGYVPEENFSKLYTSVEEQGWGILYHTPHEDDENIPTKIKNNRLVKVIKPLFSFLDVDPGYKEVDISFIFLVFMSLFVGMIIGDAGYGSVLFLCTIITMIVTRLKGNATTLTHELFLWFSLTTIIWGAITGNWFGYEPFAQLSVVSQFVLPQFSVFSSESSVNIQLFAFRVGIIQLLIAHLWSCIRVFKTKGFFASVNQLGQASMLVGLFFLVLQLLLGSYFTMPQYALHLIIGGFTLIVLTEEQKRKQNVFIGVLKGISNIITIALNSVSSFADIISYIRLYAVGLASFSIAVSFNSMGQGIMEAGGISIMLGMFVITLGHTLNLLMALLAVIVHGVRLNVLEFSGHLGMEWSGRKYNPLKNKTISRRI